MSNEGPSWIGIGAQRCGTTWFTDLLLQHPDVDVARGIKEHGSLYRYGLMRDWDSAAREEYRAIFTSTERKLGEFTPYYLRAPWICELAADALPEETPILVLVRDPIDRFASALRHEMATAIRRYIKHAKALRGATGRANEQSPTWLPRVPSAGTKRARRMALLDRVARASSDWWVWGPPKKKKERFPDRTWLRYVGSDVSWAGMYAAQLDPWIAALPEERFIVIQYEKLRQDPQHYTDLVWERLGLDPVPLTEIERPSSASVEIQYWLPEDYPHVVRALQRTYRPDAERLAARFDIDLGLWKRTMTDA